MLQSHDTPRRHASLRGQQDVWPNYTGFDGDTLETEVAQRWLEPAKKDSK